ncbi:antibiotic biosynthesis monooxygenase [Streptomyces sp. P38-E01]|uniref:Antibiotic biosynthesis monooxygenase n=1 Tax=Streptomyces tardus TaxID=2780544 RepID=A0A949JHT1_9ACTN|nr:antibiotic biosynthesis monooxygenase [Streptomyces tardus]MBU7598844.1 antibiotic biosynthesis monooxygenase [Streptomyces tardus]
MTTLQLPDLARPDAGTTLISEWIVDTPDRQRRAGRALLEEWGELSARFRPEAFLRLSCFASADGRVLLSVAQWADDDALLAFVREHRAEMVGSIDREVPGIRRPGLIRCRLAHTVVPDGVGADTTDVIVARAESGPASDAVRWAEATADRLRASPPAGAGTAHVFVSGDSTRGLLYAPVTQANDVAGARLYRLLGAVTGPSPGTDDTGPSGGSSAF